MRTRTIRAALIRWTLPAAALLVAANLALAQQPPATESKPVQPPAAKEKGPAQKDREPTLEDQLAQALKDNPDIRVAEAKVQEAEAELDRTRLQIAQKVVALQADLQKARAKVAYQESQFKRVQGLFEQKAIDQKLVDERENNLEAAKAELAALEAQLSALLGKPPKKAAAETKRQDYDAAVSGAVRFLSQIQAGQDQATALSLLSLAAAQQAAPVPVAEKVRKALDTPITVNFKDVPFAEVLDYLQDKAGVVIRDQLTRHYPQGGPKITLRFPEPLPLRAVLQALEDEVQDEVPDVVANKGLDLRFVVRDYGLLAVPTGNVPPGAVLLDRLPDKLPAHAADKNPPAENVEGMVTKVDAKTGLVTVSVGSDDGLVKGHTLEVFRVNPAKYLGTVRVLETTPHEAVAQPVGRLLAPVQQGDKVASKILGN